MFKLVVITIILVLFLGQFTYSKNNNGKLEDTNRELPQHYVPPHSLDVLKEWNLVRAIGENKYNATTYLTKIDLKYVSLVPNIYEVRLENVCFEEVGLKFFKNFKHLKVLSFDQSNLTDVGLKHLVNCDKLTMLNLSDTLITKESLKVLAKIKSLKHLYLYKTRLTYFEVLNFRKNNPNIKVYWE